MMKKDKIILVVLLFILIILIVSLSYAFFNYSRSGIDNVITLGTLELTLDDVNTISLDNVYPISDEEGLSLDGYSFVLKNKGDTDVNYIIYLEDEDIDQSYVRLDDKYLKYSLSKNETVGSADFLENLEVNGKRILDQGTISKGDVYYYTLKIWPTIDVDGDFSNQVWQGKIVIEGNQVN